MQLINKPDYSYLAPDKNLEGVKLFFISRQLGISPTEIKKDYPEPPSLNVLARISAHFPVNIRQLTFMNQVHSDMIVTKNNKKQSFPTADAMITNIKDIALAIKTADCVPIFLFDKKNRVISAIHAGWRGTALKIVKKTIKKLQQEFKSDVSDIEAFIGPAINAGCYEVGREVYEFFGFLGKRRADFFNKSKNNKYFMDIKGINAYLLEEEGVLPENIEVSELCTHCEEKLFYSYRRDKEASGRNISFIILT